MYDALARLIEQAEKEDKKIWQIALADQAAGEGRGEAEVFERMRAVFQAMKASVDEGRREGLKSLGGMLQGAGPKLAARAERAAAGEGKPTLSGVPMVRAIARATATAEANAGMRLVVACPTAGSSGVTPAALLALRDAFGAEEDVLVQALFAVGAIGAVIATRASLSGAEGGCQAEVGSASAMAAGGLTEAAGGSPRQVGWAVSLALMNLMGLACDPVAGLVEIPCVQRNAIGVANALICADMALSGVDPVIPADEAIDAMGEVGCMLPREIRETGIGGVAGTPTGKAIAARIFGRE